MDIKEIYKLLVIHDVDSTVLNNIWSLFKIIMVIQVLSTFMMDLFRFP